MWFVPLGKAHGTPMPEAPVKFVEGVDVWVVAVHGVTTTRDGRFEFHPVMHMLQGLVQQMSFQGQPLEGRGGLVHPSTSPTVHGLTGNGVQFKAVGPEVTVAGRGNHHLFKGVKTCFRFKLTFKVQTTLFQKEYVGLAVLQEFFLEIKDVILLSQVRMPLEELGPLVHRRVVRHVIMGHQQGSHVGLVLVRVEQMGKVPLSQFHQAKGVRELGQLHGKKAHGINEPHAMFFETSQLEHFAPVPDLLESRL